MTPLRKVSCILYGVSNERFRLDLGAHAANRATIFVVPFGTVDVRGGLCEAEAPAWQRREPRV
jgi:hypothetical protein